MTVAMSRHPSSHVAGGGSDPLLSPHMSSSASLPLFVDENELALASLPLASLLPLPLSSPRLPAAAAQQERMLSYSLFLLSPAAPELPHHSHEWGSPAATRATIADASTDSAPAISTRTPTGGTAGKPQLSEQNAAAADNDCSVNRALRKKRRQRQCDVQRRHKENTGFDRLQELLLGSRGGRDEKKKQRVLGPGPRRGERNGGSERNLLKADILHESAARIEQLERALQQVSAVQSLHSSALMHSSVCISAIHVPSGCMLDLSESCLRLTRRERSWAVNRRFLPSLHVVQTNTSCITRPQLHSECKAAERTLCRPAGGALQETRILPQSPASVQLMQQLYAGEVDTICAVWRSQFGDGRVMEYMAHCWIREWETHDDGTRSPLCLVGLLSTSELVCVD